jgi:hypothetical protein
MIKTVFFLVVCLTTAKKNPYSEWGKLEKEVCGSWDSKIQKGCKRAAKDANLNLNDPVDKDKYSDCMIEGQLKKKRYCWAVLPSRHEIWC